MTSRERRGNGRGSGKGRGNVEPRTEKQEQKSDHGRIVQLPSAMQREPATPLTDAMTEDGFCQPSLIIGNSDHQSRTPALPFTDLLDTQSNILILDHRNFHSRSANFKGRPAKIDT